LANSQTPAASAASNSESQEETQAAKKRKLTSKVWDHFSKIVQGTLTFDSFLFYIWNFHLINILIHWILNQRTVWKRRNATIAMQSFCVFRPQGRPISIDTLCNVFLSTERETLVN
jgi:hypothetical protein